MMTTTQQNSMVSVLIPAYNRPDYTRKTLKSIVEQEHRPIEVILSDDCSPNSLQPLAEEFSVYENDLFKIRYFRHSENLGVMENVTFAIEQATGKYVILFAHDNWFTDTKFIAEAVEILETHPSCYMCVANAVWEHTGAEMLKAPERFTGKKEWTVLPGNEFIRLWMRIKPEGIGWTPALVLDRHASLSLGAFQEPFLVSEEASAKLEMARDNIMAYVFVLASAGDVALTGKVVCVNGVILDSYSRSGEWERSHKRAKFVVFYNIYRSNLNGKYARAVKAAARKQLLTRIKTTEPDFRIIRFYNYEAGVMFFMGLSFFYKSWRGVLRSLSLLKRKVIGAIAIFR